MKKLRYGNTNTYWINGLLFDTDMPGTMPAFYRAIGQNGIPMDSIRFVIASHYHPDHIGLVSELTEKGVTLLIAEHQLPHIHFADGILKRQTGGAYRPIDETKAVVFRTEESRALLRRIGIDGVIIPTRSHSPDGIALLTDSGECFAGDLEPQSYIGGYEPGSALEKDWEAILRYGPRIVYFGHAPEQAPEKA